MALTVTRDPATLSYLLTDELYIVSDEGLSADLEETAPEAAVQQAGLADHPEKKKADSPPADRPESKQALIIVDYPGSTGVPDAERDYLNKILASVDLEQEDVVILNYATAPETRFEQLKVSFNCSGMLIFGLAPEKLDIPVPLSPYTMTRLDGIDILASDRLDQLRPDVAKRKQLWTGLQKIFKEKQAAGKK